MTTKRTDITREDAALLILSQLGKNASLHSLGELHYVFGALGAAKPLGKGKTLRDALEDAGLNVPSASGEVRYIQTGTRVMKAGELICNARSNAMAKRIANALNAYTPDRRGI